MELFAVQQDKLMTYHEMTNSHFHEFYEIYYLSSGEKKLFFEDNIYYIFKGDLVFINRFAIHRMMSTNNLGRERTLVYFHEDMLGAHRELLQDDFCPFRVGSPVLSLNSVEQKHVEELLGKMIDEYARKRRNYHICLEALLTELLVFAIRCREKRMESDEKEEKTHHPRIMEIVQYINHHYSGIITLETLSSHFHISPYYLSRLFKETTGFMFIEYVVNLRVKEAQRLLRETELPIDTVYKEVGFNNSAHFYKMFKKLTGFSPIKYRKNH